MTRSQIRQFVRTPRGKLTVALTILALTWLILLFNYFGGLSSFVPDAVRDAKAENELRRLQGELRKVEAEWRKFEQQQQAVRDLVASAWREEQHGEIDTMLRQNIQEVANAAEIKLNHLGAVKSSRINPDFYASELDLTFQANLRDLLNFLGRVQELQPKVYWKQYSIRPDFRSNRQRRNAVPSISGMLAQKQGEELPDQLMLNFSGTVRLIGFDGDPEKPLNNSVRGGNKK